MHHKACRAHLWVFSEGAQGAQGDCQGAQGGWPSLELPQQRPDAQVEGCIVAPVPVKGVLIADSPSLQQELHHLIVTCTAAALLAAAITPVQSLGLLAAAYT